VSRRDFTLIEVLLALLVVALMLVPLLQTHVHSVRLHEAAQTRERALLLAQSKLNEVLELGRAGKLEGYQEASEGGPTLLWRIQGQPVRAPIATPEPLPGLVYVQAVVSWRDGAGTRSLRLGSYLYSQEAADAAAAMP